MRAIQGFSAGAVLVVGSGCAGPSTEPGGPSSEVAPRHDRHVNGLHLNGLHLNGLHLNGMYLDGSSVNWMELHDLVIDGLVMNILHTGGGTLAAVGEGGEIKRGAGLVGAMITATLADGSAATLRVDGVVPSSAPDLERYAISYAPSGSAAFEPLCGESGGSPTLAIPLTGGWDESQGTPTGGARVDDPSKTTFACDGYALAKCVDLGYAPWRRVTECRAGACRVMALSPFHQACTRAMRADYCGDGTSSTRDGTLVDVWDALGVQVDEAPTWPFEAEWTVSGAKCVMSTRWVTTQEGESVASDIQQRCPSRWQAPGCGGAGSTFFAENGLTLPPRARVLLRTRAVFAM